MSKFARALGADRMLTEGRTQSHTDQEKRVDRIRPEEHPY